MRATESIPLAIVLIVGLVLGLVAAFVHPPLTFRIVRLFSSDKTQERVLEPILADFFFERAEAAAARQGVRLMGLRLVYSIALLQSGVYIIILTAFGMRSRMD